MRIFLAIVLVLHGAIHLMGFVKAFGLAEMPQLRQPISRARGVLWLLAALLLIAAGGLIWVAPAFWRIPALPGIVLSQFLIFTAWEDAKFGTIANVLLLLALVGTFLGVSTTQSLRSSGLQESGLRIGLPQPEVVGERHEVAV